VHSSGAPAAGNGMEARGGAWLSAEVGDRTEGAVGTMSRGPVVLGRPEVIVVFFIYSKTF
jgi:hypothetical protein